MHLSPLPTETPSQPAPAKSARYYQPELDVIRFIAFVSVFLYHCSFLKPHGQVLWDSVMYSGSFGMSLFFTLSSYLITTLLMKERDRTGTVAIRKFYARRVLRIWPLYFTFLIAMWVVGHFVPEWTVSKANLVSFFLLYGNWYLLYAPVAGPIMPLWSISLEEQFYLVWPTLFRSISLRAFTRVAVGLIACSLLVIYWLRSTGRPYWEIWWNTFPQMQFFALGALLAIYRDRVFRNNLRYLQRIAFGASALFVWIMGGFANQRASLGIFPAPLLTLSYIAGAAGCVLLFQTFWGASDISAAWLYLGKISYGLYVFHQLSLSIIAHIWAHVHGGSDYLPITGFSFVLTLIFASISFPLLEKPFLRWKKNFEIVRSR